MAVASLFIAMAGKTPFHRADMRRLPVTASSWDPVLPAVGSRRSLFEFTTTPWLPHLYSTPPRSSEVSPH